MSPKSPKLCSGVDAVVSVMSKFVHPSKPIFDKYPNRPNNHKLQGVVFGGGWHKFRTARCQHDYCVCLNSCQVYWPTILRQQEIHTWDRIGFIGRPLSLSRDYRHRCRRWRHSWSDSWWKQSYLWCRSKRCPKITIGSYLKPTFGRHGGLFYVKGFLLIITTI